MVVHDHSKVCGWLLYLQQPQHCGKEAIADGGVFAACCFQARSLEAKMGAVQQCVSVHQYQPAGTDMAWLTKCPMRDHFRQNARADGGVFAACCLTAPSLKAKVGLVQQCVNIRQDEPAGTRLGLGYQMTNTDSLQTGIRLLGCLCRLLFQALSLEARWRPVAAVHGHPPR